jgi:hypothetical protein
VRDRSAAGQIGERVAALQVGPPRPEARERHGHLLDEARGLHGEDGDGDQRDADGDADEERDGEDQRQGTGHAAREEVDGVREERREEDGEEAEEEESGGLGQHVEGSEQHEEREADRQRVSQQWRALGRRLISHTQAPSKKRRAARRPGREARSMPLACAGFMRDRTRGRAPEGDPAC